MILMIIIMILFTLFFYFFLQNKINNKDKSLSPSNTLTPMNSPAIFTPSNNPSLTPINSPTLLYTSEVEICNETKLLKFRVYSDKNNIKFYWIVYGKRNEIEVEPNKTDVNVKGNGPYKWI